VLAGALLISMVWLAIDNYPTLLGVAPNSALAKIFPATYAVVAVIGICWAGVLKLARPEVYEKIGFGADAVGRRAAAAEPVSGPPPATPTGGYPY
jgi:hypothetical protein